MDGTGIEMAASVPSGSQKAAPIAQIPKVCSSLSKAIPASRIWANSCSSLGRLVTVLGVKEGDYRDWSLIQKWTEKL